MFDKVKWLPLVILWIIVVIILGIFSAQLRALEVDVRVLFWGNLVLLAANLIAFMSYQQAYQQQRAHGSVQRIYAGFVFKFFILIIALVFYFMLTPKINRNGLIGCLILYLAYQLVGTAIAVRGKQKSDQKGNLNS